MCQKFGELRLGDGGGKGGCSGGGDDRERDGRFVAEKNVAMDGGGRSSRPEGLALYERSVGVSVQRRRGGHGRRRG
jgi:hypothetical protein